MKNVFTGSEDGEDDEPDGAAKMVSASKLKMKMSNLVK